MCYPDDGDGDGEMMGVSAEQPRGLAWFQLARRDRHAAKQSMPWRLGSEPCGSRPDAYRVEAWLKFEYWGEVHEIT